MKIINKKIDEVKPNKYNPNKIPEDKYKTLLNNIKEFGYIQPILIDNKGVIIDGFHRWKAMKETGHKQIKCVEFENGKSIKKYKKLLTLAMNNIRGENEQDKFEDLIKDLGFSLDYEDIEKFTGFDVNFISDIIHRPEEIEYDKLPDVDIQGEVENKGDYLILQFDSQEEIGKLKDELNLKNNNKVLKWELLKKTFKINL